MVRTGLSQHGSLLRPFRLDSRRGRCLARVDPTKLDPSSRHPRMTISNKQHEWRINRPYGLTAASTSFGRDVGTGITLGDILIQHVHACGDCCRWTARWSTVQQHNQSGPGDRKVQEPGTAVAKCRRATRELACVLASIARPLVVEHEEVVEETMIWAPCREVKQAGLCGRHRVPGL